MKGKDKLKISIDELFEPLLQPHTENQDIANLFSFPSIKFVDFETYEKFAIHVLNKRMKIIDNHIDERMPEGKQNVPLTTNLFEVLCSPFILKFALLRYLSYVFDKNESNIYVTVDFIKFIALSHTIPTRAFDIRLKKGYLDRSYERFLSKHLCFFIIERHENINKRLYLRRLHFDFVVLEAINFILSQLYISRGHFLLEHIHSYVPDSNLDTFFEEFKSDFTDSQ
jgi:hypothetical protein